MCLLRVRNPNVGPNKVSLEWTKFDNARQNYLLEAPKFSMEEFDVKTTDNFAYWNGFLANAQFPPEPSFPLVLDEDIEASEKYFFNDLTNRYRLTKSGMLTSLIPHLIRITKTRDEVNTNSKLK